MSTGEYTGRNESPQGIELRTILIVGLVMVAVGGFIVAHALTAGSQLPPTAAQEIPAAVSTNVPFAPESDAIATPLSASTPVTIKIPAIKVDAPIMRLGLNSNGTIQVPPLDNHNLAGWYDRSVTPGTKGTSVILGHVDNYAGISVFFYIKDLKRGDKIDVTLADGTTAVFSVDGVQKAVKTSFPTTEVFGNVSYPALRLVTCGGTFDPSTGSYLDSIIVYAHLTGTVGK